MDGCICTRFGVCSPARGADCVSVKTAHAVSANPPVLFKYQYVMYAPRRNHAIDFSIVAIEDRNQLHLFTSLPLDAVVRYDSCDTTRRSDQNTMKTVYIKQLVCTESPEARTTQDRSFIAYLPKNHDGATRRTQHNNL